MTTERTEGPSLRFLVPENWEGALLKDFLRKEAGVTARLLSRLKRTEGGIRLNGVPVFVIVRLRAGDVVELFPPAGSTQAPGADLPFPVLAEDDRLIIVNKPAGMPVHPSPGHDCDSLLNAFSGWLEREGRGALAFRPLYRLDKDTTGLMLLAKDGYTAARLPEYLQKTYWAVCEGKLQGEGTIALPIGLEPGSRIRRCTREQAVNPVPAVTHWKVLAGDGSHTLLALTLETGRTHQIRVHLSSIGCPLAGDDLYGGSRTVISRQALHCREALRRDTGQVFTAPLPRDFREAFPGFFPQEDFLEQFGGEEN